MAFTIFGKANCAGCDQAKNLLESKGIAYEYVDIMNSPSAMAMFRSSGFRAVPQIFKGDEHVGGITELQAAV